ncbi:hypothetical protein BG000_000226 [Podila horticola]|nr:hypothetical protein BG000_000226 [Podila horticola]
MSFAAGTQQRAESLDSNLRHGTAINNSNRSSAQSNSTSNGNRPRSTSSSKALLTLALMEAQTAVQLDNDSNITGALGAYQRAVTLLNRVMSATSSLDEQDRLRTIVQSNYSRPHRRQPHLRTRHQKISTKEMPHHKISIAH